LRTKAHLEQASLTLALQICPSTSKYFSIIEQTHQIDMLQLVQRLEQQLVLVDSM
jgi:hypothetical protein